MTHADRLYEEVAVQAGGFEFDQKDDRLAELVAFIGRHFRFNMNRLTSKLEGGALTLEWEKMDKEDNAEADIGHGVVAINADLKTGASITSLAVLVIGEVGHFIDSALITRDMRKEIASLFGVTLPTGKIDEWFPKDYWDSVGESIMGLVVYAYSDLAPSTDQLALNHKPTRAIAEKFKAIVG